jgi:hypothetical protein
VLDVDRQIETPDHRCMIARISVLTPDLSAALKDVGQLLTRGDRITGELGRALGLIAGLSPADVARADGAIADAAMLHHWRPRQSNQGLWLRLRTDVSDTEQLLRTPDLEKLFIFHRDGRLREAALLRLSGGLPNPFLFAVIAWRLNDWAQPVRAAAVRCARRCFPATAPEIVAAAATTLLARQWTWARWGDEHQPLFEAFNRNDVAACLASLLIQGRTGPMSTTLRYALRTSAIDVHLDDIARDAVQPSVRAVALETLIEGRAKWPSGYGWEWIDKSMGLRRQVTIFDHRALDVAASRSLLISRGIRDRSPAVRRVALDGVMRYMLTTREGQNFAALLAEDRSPSVRERAAFILRPR